MRYFFRYFSRIFFCLEIGELLSKEIRKHFKNNENSDFCCNSLGFTLQNISYWHIKHKRLEANT